jgi:hypothetical protein
MMTEISLPSIRNTMPWRMMAGGNASDSGSPTMEPSATATINTDMHVPSSTNVSASPNGLLVRKSGITEPSTGLTRHTHVSTIRRIPTPAVTTAILQWERAVNLDVPVGLGPFSFTG